MGATLALIYPRLELFFDRKNMNKGLETYNRGYSLVVIHLTTNQPLRCLNRAEQTGSLLVSWELTTNNLNSIVRSSGGVRIEKLGHAT